MKYVNYDKNTGKILGYYDDTIHQTIPEPNLQITEEQWKEAVNNNYNFVDAKNKALGKKDFRTLDGIKQAKKQQIESLYNKKRQKPIEVNGNTFQADDKSVQAMKDYLSVGSNPKWLDVNNKFIDIDLKVLLKAIVDRTNGLFVKKVEAKKKVDNATTKEEVEGVIYE